MTPDEIRVAIRLLGQRVYLWGYHEVKYNRYEGYYIDWFCPDPHEEHDEVFDKKGNFVRSWGAFGRRFWGPRRFKPTDFSTETSRGRLLAYLFNHDA
jgi:hypothetical protein